MCGICERATFTSALNKFIAKFNNRSPLPAASLFAIKKRSPMMMMMMLPLLLIRTMLVIVMVMLMARERREGESARREGYVWLV